MKTRSYRLLAAALLNLALLASQPSYAFEAEGNPTRTTFHKAAIDGVEVFYRQAGPVDAPTIVLLHGFPTSSHMFRNLIPQLSDKFHVIAPDFPGYGNSDVPDREKFEYSFDNLANVVDKLLEKLEIDRYALYLMDYGAPVGFRIATAHPQRVTGLVIQNGNAYDEGLDNPFWEPIKKYWDSESADDREALRGLLSRDATIWQYTHGTRNPTSISPDNWNIDQPLLDRPGNQEIQLDLFLSYGTNPPLYPKWQQYLRDHQPPTLIVWGKNDQIFPAAGAYPYQRDLQQIEFHLLDTGHFVLEEELDFVSKRINSFLSQINE